MTQRQLNAGIARLIGALDDESILDMQSVDGELDAAIVEAVNDLHARGAPRPVIVMLGQASEMARSELQSSQVRGRRRAARRDAPPRESPTASLVAPQPTRPTRSGPGTVQKVRTPKFIQMNDRPRIAHDDHRWRDLSRLHEGPIGRPPS